MPVQMHDDEQQAQRWTVIQAEACGVTGTKTAGPAFHPRQLDTVAPGGWYTIIRPPAGVDPERTLAFARGEVGAHYGFVTIGSIAIDKVTPLWFHMPFRRPGTWICSALGAESLRFGGWHHRWPDVYNVDPAEAMHALLESGGVQLASLSDARPGDVGFCHGTGLISAAIRFAQRKEPDAEVNHMFVLDRYRLVDSIAESQ